MEEIQCERCGNLLTAEELETNVDIPDPYELEIHECEVPCTVCDKCYQELCEDI